MNRLYYGDNLDVLRASITDESVDLIYLDPPFNSKRDYNVLFKSPKGQSSDAQIVAFEDFWHWGPQAEREFSEILRSPNTDVAELMPALRSFLGENDMLAYLTMMANRLLELHRVLKFTGSLYLHCDPTASHYLKIVLDAVFGHDNFRNEIVWNRTNAHNLVTKRYGRIHDIIFFYSKSASFTFNHLFTEYSPEQMSRFKTDADGRRYKAENLTMVSSSPSRKFTWRGSTPAPNRAWGFDLDDLERLWSSGLILAKKDGSPRLDGWKIFLDDLAGKPLNDVWADVSRIANTSDERLKYPTQKPVALLDRIIEVSSNVGDVVLDPFCGCGTAVYSAQSLKRSWIGIDVTHLAISLIEKRLRDAFPSIKFDVLGTPTDFDGARDLASRDKYQFQWWACSLVGAQPYQGKKKGADGGIDGLIFFEDEKSKAKRVIVSVKGGENVTLTMLKDLIATVQGEKAAIGLFVTLVPPTRPMIVEAARAGFYDSPTGKSYARIQILMIEGLMNGSERPNYPFADGGGMTFKRTKVEVRGTTQRELFEPGRSEVESLPMSALIIDSEDD